MLLFWSSLSGGRVGMRRKGWKRTERMRNETERIKEKRRHREKAGGDGGKGWREGKHDSQSSLLP